MPHHFLITLLMLCKLRNEAVVKQEWAVWADGNAHGVESFCDLHLISILFQLVYDAPSCGTKLNELPQQAVELLRDSFHYLN